MKTPISLITLLAFVSLSLIAFSQKAQWVVYNTANSGIDDDEVRCLSIDKNNVKWIGTVNDAVSTFDGTNWTHYDDKNSYIYDNYILTVMTDSENSKWIGTRSAGLVKYDGSKWHLFDKTHCAIPDNKVYSVLERNDSLWVGTMHGLGCFLKDSSWLVYNTTNSGLAAEEIREIVSDSKNNLWIATWGGGVSKFDGKNWTTFDKSNSIIPTDACVSIFYDGANIWIGTSNSGLVKYDGTNWTLYTSTNSLLPQNTVSKTTKEGNKLWFATAGGVGMLENNTWTVYKTTNSGLPNNVTKSIRIDKDNNKWIATSGGLAVFNENGVVGIDESKLIQNDFLLKHNSPNPFNASTNISFSLINKSHVKLVIFDIMGKEINTLLDETKSPGTYNIKWSPANLKSGMYFYSLYCNNSFQTKKMLLIR